MLVSTLTLAFAALLPVSVAAPTDIAEPETQPALDFVDEGSNATMSLAATTNPAAHFYLFTGGTCLTGAGYSRADGICYTTGLVGWNSLSIERFYGSCHDIRVFSDINCKGSYADLGIKDRCWSVSSRLSYQIFC